MKQLRTAGFGKARIYPVLLIAVIALCWPVPGRAQDVGSDGTPEPEATPEPDAAPAPEATRRPAIDIVPAILQEFILTDNKDLDPEGEEDPGVISRTSLELNVHLEPTQGRLSTLGDARFALVFDTDEGELDYEIDGLLGARGEVLEDWFFVDAAALATRSLTDGRGRVSGTGRTDDDQKVIYAGMLSPFVPLEIGDLSDAELRYRRVQVEADEADDQDAGDDEGTGDSTSDVFSFVTSTGDRFTRFDVTSELAYERVRTEDEDGELDWQTASVQGVYVLTRRFSLLASTGYDWVDTEDFEDDPEGPRLMGGFGFHPGPRTAFEISAGTRFGEPAVESFASYQITPRLLATGSVVDGLESETSILAELPFQSSIDPETGTLVETRTGLPFNPGGYLTLGGGLDRVALVRRYRATLGGYYRFDTYSLDLIREEREMDVEGDETVHGLYANWDRRLSPRLIVGAFGAYGETDSEDGEDDERTIIGGLDASYEWIQDLTFSLAYVHTRNDAEDEDESYRENAIIFSVRKAF